MQILIAILALTVAAGAYAYLAYDRFLSTPVTPPGGKAVFEVKRGTTLRTLARQLDEAGIIEDVEVPVAGSLFYLWAHWIQGVGSQIKAGEYLFEGPRTPSAVLQALTSGRVRTYRITIPEGLRLDEVAQLYERAGLASASELMRLARDPAFAQSLGVPHDSLEGYLFPDTYTFARGVPARRILRRMVERFEEAWKEAERHRRPEVTLSKHEAVTLASIIEKETGAAEERRRISCVFHNRLRDGWKLQTDPTVIYAKILRGAWDGNITKADLRYPHPYNTYTTPGLPPGPIASPGLEALIAAVDPSECGDYFFVSRNDGTHVFCPTLECHNRAVDRFQRRRRAK
ncbi:MAG: endolytic transglycosylase MltG [Deltaproteobacteria bacterium]|nr:MAG: endolytic transglycosylase MltG [Deltaproteobacteria bacterium]